MAESVTVESQRAARRNRAGPRVRAASIALLLQEMPLSGRNLYNLLALQPGVTGRGLLRVDQRRRRRRRFVRRRIGAAHQRQRPARRGQQLHRRRHQHQRRRARRHHQPDAQHRVGRGSARGVEQLLGRRRPQPRRADPGDHQGAARTSSAAAAPTTSPSNQLSAKNVFETSVPEFSKNQFGYSLGGPIVAQPPLLLHLVRRAAADRARAARRSRSRRRSSATSSCRRGPNSIAAQLLRDFAPAVDPTSNFRDLGSPAPGANVDRSGRRHHGCRHARSSFRRDGATAISSAPGSTTSCSPARIASTATSTAPTSYAVTGGIRPAFNRPTPNWTHFGNVNYTHTFSSTKLNEFRGGVMRLVGLPDTPRASRDSRASPSPAPPASASRAIRTAGGRPTGTSRTSSPWVALGAHAEDGRRAAADVRLGDQHQQLHPRLLVLEPAEFRRRRGAADDPLRRSAHRRAGDRVFGADADRVGASSSTTTGR